MTPVKEGWPNEWRSWEEAVRVYHMLKDNKSEGFTWTSLALRVAGSKDLAHEVRCFFDYRYVKNYETAKALRIFRDRQRERNTFNIISLPTVGGKQYEYKVRRFHDTNLKENI